MHNKLKQLFSQSAWYGLSSILARFLNYLLTPLYTNVFKEQGNGEIASIYAAITFLNILFTFGLETYFFRTCTQENKTKTFNQTFSLLLVCNVIFGGVCFLLFPQIQVLLSLRNSTLLSYALVIILFDALSALPFALLRYENKIRAYTFLRMSNIVLNIFFNLFFLVYCPYLQKHNPHNPLLIIYNSSLTIEYVFISNVIASAFSFVCTFFILFKWRWHWHWKSVKQTLAYASPLLIVGFSGMVNETIDRIMLPKLLTGDIAYRFSQNGIYAANYKLSILITLFIHTFRMGAEPFFFKNAKEKNAPELYAKVMNYFVIICCCGFLCVMLFLNLWQYFINAHRNAGFAEGLKIVPILLCANIFLGMYYNVSVWYKIKNKTLYGAAIALAGAVITIVGNYLFIPQYSYVACAWTTCLCYAAMLVVAYVWGQKHFSVPYAKFRISLYLLLAVALGSGHYFLFFHSHFIFACILGILFFGVFISVVFFAERKTFRLN